MKNMKLKRLACAALASCALLSASIPAAFAVTTDTIEFDITYPGDTLSQKVLKSTRNYDNYFYVTPHYFSRTGTLNCISIRHDDTSVYSRNIALMSTHIGTTKSAPYLSKAEGGYYYYMSGTATVNLNVSGNYTP